MATLALQTAGAVTPVAAAGGGDQIPQGTKASGWHLPVVLVVRNADTTATNVTVAGTPVVSVPGTSGLAVIPVLGGRYGSLRAVTYSKVTALTVAAVRLTDPLD